MINYSSYKLWLTELPLKVFFLSLIDQVYKVRMEDACLWVVLGYFSDFHLLALEAKNKETSWVILLEIVNVPSTAFSSI